MPKKRPSPSSPSFFGAFPASKPISKTVEPTSISEEVRPETAIIYCEGNFGEIGGKTANGLAHHSGNYKILSIIDSEKEGQDAGKVLGGEPSGIPIYRDLGTALAHAGRAPVHLIVGIAPESGMLSHTQRRLLLRAIGYGINIVNGLDEILSDDPEFAAACAKSGVVIRDLKKLG